MQITNIIQCFLERTEFWLQRYQSLLVGIVALRIAFNQMKIARRLAAITISQEELRMAERSTQVALATIYVDKLLESAREMGFRLISVAEHRDTEAVKEGQPVYRWDEPLRLAGIIKSHAIEIDLEKLEASAALAFPTRAPLIVRLAVAIQTIAGVNEGSATNLINEALSDLFVYWSALHAIRPDARARQSA